MSVSMFPNILFATIKILKTIKTPRPINWDKKLLEKVHTEVKKVLYMIWKGLVILRKKIENT